MTPMDDYGLGRTLRFLSELQRWRWGLQVVHWISALQWCFGVLAELLGRIFFLVLTSKFEEICDIIKELLME